MSSATKWIFRFRKTNSFPQLSRNYSQKNYTKTLLKPSVKYLCALGGGLVAYTYFKLRNPIIVDAFNPKKIKVSDTFILYNSI